MTWIVECFSPDLAVLVDAFYSFLPLLCTRPLPVYFPGSCDQSWINRKYHSQTSQPPGSHRAAALIVKVPSLPWNHAEHEENDAEVSEQRPLS